MSARSSRGHNAAESPTKTANAGNGRSGRTSSGASPASSIVPESTATRHRGRRARKRSFSPDDGSGDLPCSVDEAGSSISECMSSSSISDQSERSFQKRRKDLDQSPEDEDAYSRRRERNNIAVRKSRAKKREEIQQFVDKQEKLQSEVDLIIVQNSRLQSLLDEVEDGLLDDTKTKDELTSLVHRAKAQLEQNA